MLSEDTPLNPKRRSLTFADKFEVKFFFKAEAPKDIALCETSFTTGSETSGYYDDDDYWDPEDSYDEDDYYDENQDYEEYYDYEDDSEYYSSQSYGYHPSRDYQNYTTSEYDDYYHYDYDYYNDVVNFSIHYDVNHSTDHYHNFTPESYDSEEESRGRCIGELFGRIRNDEERDFQTANERTNTRRLALAKLEKGLFRRQQIRDSETYSETEESEASISNSESDPFDEPLPPPTTQDYLRDLKKRSTSPVTIKATFTTRDMPISIPISNHNAYKVARGHEVNKSFEEFKKRLPFTTDFSERLRPTSPSLLDDENPFSALDDTLLSCTPLTIINKSPLVVNLSTNSKDRIQDILKSSSNTKSYDVKYMSSFNSKDLVKTISNNNLLSNTKSTTLLSNVHNNTNSKGVNNKGVKKRSRSYSSPSSLQQLLPCY